MKRATKSATIVSAVKNFHLPLPEDVYALLREEAAALGRPATVIAREAIEAWLRERRRASVREGIAAYAARHAGTTADLDPALEAASLELWRPRRRRRR
jgi:predicted transcriptional regulator